MTKNVIYTGWAEMQEPAGTPGNPGMIQEVLGSMGASGRITGPMDESASGRIMCNYRLQLIGQNRPIVTCRPMLNLFFTE